MFTIKRKFLYQCDSCRKVIELEFDNDKDIEDALEDKMYVECHCKGICLVLRD